MGGQFSRALGSPGSLTGSVATAGLQKLGTEEQEVGLVCSGTLKICLVAP